MKLQTVKCVFFLFSCTTLVKDALSSSYDYAINCERVDYDDTLCPDVETVIESAIQACASDATGGLFNKLPFKSNRLRNLRNPQQDEAELRQLNSCQTCVSCHTCACRYWPSYYCRDTCGDGCPCSRRLLENEMDNNQEITTETVKEEEVFSYDVQGQGTRKLGVNATASSAIGSTCQIALRTLAASLALTGNNCLGNPSELICYATAFD